MGGPEVRCQNIELLFRGVFVGSRGGSGGGGSLGQDLPPPFWGTQKNHKEGKRCQART